MNTRAFWKYYLDVNLYNFYFSIIFAFTSGFFWALVIFCSFGLFVGALGYQYFKKNEYYMYYNLGFTKLKLLKNVWFLNLISSILLTLTAVLISLL